MAKIVVVTNVGLRKDIYFLDSCSVVNFMLFYIKLCSISLGILCSAHVQMTL